MGTRGCISEYNFGTFDARINYANDFAALFQGNSIWKTCLMFQCEKPILNKIYRFLHSLMRLPCEISRHFSILGPACKDGKRIVHTWNSQNKSFSFDSLR